jgi:hypothetical protein
LIQHYGNAILRLAGITDFVTWQPVQSESVAPRRLPDGLLEVTFPDEQTPVLVLIEIETYPEADADRQVLDDIMIILLERKQLPEVISLVLKPKGNLEVRGEVIRRGRRGRTELRGKWPVVRLWELEANDLIETGNPGLVPWAVLAHSALKPEELVTRCRDTIQTTASAEHRESLLVVTQILASLAFPKQQFLNLFGGTPVLMDLMDTALADELRKVIREQLRAETRLLILRENILEAIEARFGVVPPEITTQINAITDDTRLKGLLRFAITCADINAFSVELSTT